MARAASTYRAARREAARKCLVLNQWGSSPLRVWHSGVKHEPHTVLVDGKMVERIIARHWQVLVRPLPAIMRHAIAAGIIKEKAAA